jgi:hypothetical protein
MIVYALNYGCYSDYGVGPIFSTREKAQEYMDLIPGDWNDVEEYELDPPGVAEVKAKFSCWRIWMERDGTVFRYFAEKISQYNVGGTAVLCREHRDGLDRFILDTVVMARDLKHAVKIANETRGMMIALGKWQ